MLILLSDTGIVAFAAGITPIRADAGSFSSAQSIAVCKSGWGCSSSARTNSSLQVGYEHRMHARRIAGDLESFVPPHLESFALKALEDGFDG